MYIMCVYTHVEIVATDKLLIDRHSSDKNSGDLVNSSSTVSNYLLYLATTIFCS